MAATKAFAVRSGGGIATDRGPSFSLPLRFFLLGTAGYAATTAMTALFGLDGSAVWGPRTLALTHLLTLGFILPMIMGACYQLVPVVLLARIRPEGLGKLGFWPYALGVPLMVLGFWRWQPPLLALGGALTVGGFLLFLLTLAASLARGAEWGKVGAFLGVSLTAMLLAAAIGLGRALTFAGWLNFSMPNAFAAHAALAILGCASLLIYGVAYRLVPMFAVGHEGQQLAWPVLGFGGLGAGAVAVGNLTEHPIAVQLGLLACAVAACLWALDARRLFNSRTRRHLDTGLTYAATAIAWMLTACALMLALAWGGVSGPRWSIAIAAVALVGWVGFSILGYFHKILPFLAWYHRYSALVGKRKTPLIRDLFDEKSAWAGFWASQLGLAVLVLSLLLGVPWGVQAGAALLLLGAAATARMVWECLTR